MKITKSELREIIREIMTESSNVGPDGNWYPHPVNFTGKRYKDYKHMGSSKHYVDYYDGTSKNSDGTPKKHTVSFRTRPQYLKFMEKLKSQGYKGIWEK